MARIQFSMSQARLLQCYKHISFACPTLLLLILTAIQGSPLRAQDAAQGPIAPPPEHHVTRIGNLPGPGPPPPPPGAKIARLFPKKEEDYTLSRPPFP